MSCPPCPHCQSEFVYQDQSLFICPECAHEWNAEDAAAENELNICDANGAVLAEGDKVTFVKDLKIKGSSQVLKIGTKAVIRRIHDKADHQLDCKVTGAADMFVTAKFVKKV